MSLKPSPIIEIPEETVEVVRAVFAKGNVYMLMRDTLGAIYRDEDFAALFPTVGQPAEASWRLALVTMMQFRENLTDRQAAEAGQRQRTDATHVVAAVHLLTRIEMVGETLRQALNHLATVVPDWLRDHVPSDWYERYSKSFDEYRMPKAETALLTLAEQIGQDGLQLLLQIDSETHLH